jgi:putative IMPACT (imprinted ancient) family translation regulator
MRFSWEAASVDGGLISAFGKGVTQIEVEAQKHRFFGVVE